MRFLPACAFGFLLAVASSSPAEAQIVQNDCPANASDCSVRVPGAISSDTLANRFSMTVNVDSDFGGDIQAAINACQTCTIVLAPRAYTVAGPIILTDPTAGHNFQGRILMYGATVTFTNSGAATDTDADMQHGFRAYPKTNGAGGDVSGTVDLIIEGGQLIGPTHGASIYLANSQTPQIRNVKFGISSNIQSSRYNIALETSINAHIVDNNFTGFINAGIGLLMSGNPNVWYGPTPAMSYWNDSPAIENNKFTANLVGALAHVLDTGSHSEATRYFKGNLFYNGTLSDAAYGYLGRTSEPYFVSNWWENISYPISVLGQNGLYPGGSAYLIPGVTAAEPAGTYALSNFPDGYSYSLAVWGSWFASPVNAINFTGIRIGSVNIGNNISRLVSGYNLISDYGVSTQYVTDFGNTVINYSGGGAYKSIPAPSNFGTAYNLGSAANKNVGTSGATVPLLNGANTWSALQTFSSGISSSGNVAGPYINLFLNQINEFATNGLGTIAINYLGYQNSNSQFRNLLVGDGKGAIIAQFEGSTKRTRLGSGTAPAYPLDVTGDINSSTAVRVAGVAIQPTLSGTTGSIGGGALVAGDCASGTATVTGVTSAMGIVATPAGDPMAIASQGVSVSAWVSATDTVTVAVCALIATTPTARAYNIRAIP